MRLTGSGRPGSNVPLLAVLLTTCASSTALANGIPGTFDVTHIVAYINFPLNGLLLLLLFEMAYRGREDVPFTPTTFLLTFTLSVAALTFIGAILDGFMDYSSPAMLMTIGLVVGLTGGYISVRYLGFTSRQGAVTFLVFLVYNHILWTIGRMVGPWLGTLWDNLWLIHLCYLLFIVLTVSFALVLLRQSRIVTVLPHTGDRGLERLEHGPAWERAKAVLSERTLTELLVVCIVTMVIAVVIPMTNGSLL